MVGVIILMWLGKMGRGKERAMERVGLMGSMVLLILIVGEWGQMKGSGVEGIESYKWMGGVIIMGVDGVSINFLLLMGIVIPISIMAGRQSIQYMLKEYLMSIILVEVILIGLFTAMDILIFYIMFEAVVIPMYIMIGI